MTQGATAPLHRLLILAVFAAAMALRWDLANHFTHIDDIGVATTLLASDTVNTTEHIAARIAAASHGHADTAGLLRRVSGLPMAAPLAPVIAFAARSISIPRQWTYAPLQFVVTSALLHGAHTYREILFRGRLPSWIAAMCSIWIMLLVARRLWPDAVFRGAHVLVATIVGVSAGLVVNSKQMQNYAAGVLGMSLMLLLFLTVADGKRAPSWRAAVLIGVALALISSVQYQLLVFTPAFLGAWFLARRCRVDARAICVAGATWGVLVAPLYVMFLRHMTTRGINWNAGPAEEFAFHPARTPAAVIGRVFTFFPRNAYLTFESVVSPVVDSHPLYRVIGVTLAAVAIVGAVSVARNRHRRMRALVTFSALLAVTYVAFILLHRFTLGPTRHTLVLLPFAAICVTAGILAMAPLLRALAEVLPLALAGLLAVVALADVPRLFDSRRDPVDEAKLADALRSNGVSMVVAYEWTTNLRLMPSVLAKVPVFESLPTGTKGEWISAPRATTLDRIAFFSTRLPLDDAVFDSLRAVVNRDSAIVKAGLGLPARSGFRTVLRQAVCSDVEVDISRRTHNGTNELFLEVLERKDAVRQAPRE